MAGDLRSALRAGARTGTSRTLPLAVLLVVLVIVAAGIGGASDFKGARWVPNLNVSSTHSTQTHRTSVPPSAAAKPRRRNTGGGVPRWLIVTAIVLVALALAVLLWRLLRGRRLPAAPTRQGATVAATRTVEPEAEPEPEPERLLTGIELALQLLDEPREPADAIVRAWLGLQETAEESGIVRHPSETPTEFTARILGGAFTDDRALRTLLRLYLRTRFGDHPVTAQDLAEVREALRQLVTSWRDAGRAPQAGAR